ncbi:MAG: trigger factor [Lachnospiraceae bacterium]|nr:trigger factor [Lachnospiraceae bacterium]
MSVQIEDLGKNMVKLTIEVSEDKVEEALKATYNAQKNRISIPGFRKGKVPRAVIERMYGPEIFYEDAANKLIREEYPTAADESEVDIVSAPTIDVVQLEKGKPFIFTAEVAKKPEVTLGQYQGIQITKLDTAVTDEEVEERLEQERISNARIVTAEDKEIAEGDTAVIDYNGFVDGIEFEGGTANDYALEIGSHTFIDTFEDQLIGKKAGDELDVNVTFPEEYHAEELAGKPAVFKVKIHEVRTRELPELDDEFASDVSEYETLAEYKDAIRKELEKSKQEETRALQENDAVRKIVDNSEMEIPDAMVESQIDSLIREFAQRLASQGMGLDQYMQYTGSNMDQLKEQLRPEALDRIQGSLVLEAIAKEQKFEITDAEIDAEIADMAKNYGMEAEQLKDGIGEGERESIQKNLEIRKAIDFILEHAEEVEEQE